MVVILVASGGGVLLSCSSKHVVECQGRSAHAVALKSYGAKVTVTGTPPRITSVLDFDGRLWDSFGDLNFAPTAVSVAANAVRGIAGQVVLVKDRSAVNFASSESFGTF